ncbi:MAG: U32 family peptidase [Lachnospiraceae bacterium]|nr:U32 family peptidase [Lachnospiraceae bacterium]
MFKPELLSPAGSPESVYAAVNNGADAVYLGGKQFGARQLADNFSNTELEDIIDYCHLRGVKVYVTVNTLYKEKELKPMMDFVKFLYEAGADAVIVQDIGAAMLIKEHYPTLSIHASTQLTANNIEDVRFLKSKGFDKVVLSRELSLEEIKEIKNGVDIELEVFIHGALCVSYSGQCIMSSMLGGRSGNRGRCAQICRLPFSLHNGYTKISAGHLLSPKDIETLEILPELIKIGIDSFKIEGRMKNPEYVAGATSVYRKHIDSYLASPEDYVMNNSDKKALTQLFNRGGFTNGYFNIHSGMDMMCPERPKTWGLMAGFVDSYNKKLGKAVIRTREPFVPGDGIEIWTRTEPHVGTNISKPSKAGEYITVNITGDINKNDPVYKTNDKALRDALNKTWEKNTRTKDISMDFTAFVGKPMTLKVWDNDGNFAFVEGPVVEEATGKAATMESIAERLSKTGGTPFNAETVFVRLNGSVFIPVSVLNELRRNAVEKLEKAIISSYKNKDVKSYKKSFKAGESTKNKKLTVTVNTFSQFLAASFYRNVEAIYFELNKELIDNYKECIDTCHKNNIKFFVALPRIYRSFTKELYGEFIDTLKNSSIDGFLIRSAGQKELIGNKVFVVDYNMNTFNSASINTWKKEGALRICLSPELNLTEIKQIADSDCEAIGYGYMPLMVTHQCPVGNFDGNKKDHIFCAKKGHKDEYVLKDRKGEEFRVFTDCDNCTAYILNGRPLSILKHYDEIAYNPCGYIRLIFTVEDAKKTDSVMRAFNKLAGGGETYYDEVKSVIKALNDIGATKGHYFRGVE